MNEFLPIAWPIAAVIITLVANARIREILADRRNVANPALEPLEQRMKAVEARLSNVALQAGLSLPDSE